MACLVMAMLALTFVRQGEDHRALHPSRPFELYSNFDISHLIRTDMSWYELLDIRQQLRRPTLAFYVDKIGVRGKPNGILDPRA